MKSFLFNLYNNIVFVLIASLMIASCADPESSTVTLPDSTLIPIETEIVPPSPVPQDPLIEIQKLIDDAGLLPEVTPMNSSIGSETAPEELSDFTIGTKTTCVAQNNQYSDNISPFGAYGNPNESILWPGAIIQGKTLISGDFVPIRGDRAAGTITLVIPDTGEGSSSRRVDNPIQGRTQDIVELLLPDELNPPADIIHHSSFVQSQYQANLFLARSLGVGLFENANAIGKIGNSLNMEVDISVEGAINYSKNKNYSIVVFQQRYYTIRFDPDEVGASMFENPNSENLQQSMGVDNPPIYVSSVDYGRYMIAVVSSNESLLNLGAALSHQAQLGAGESITVGDVPGRPETNIDIDIGVHEAITAEVDFEAFLNNIDVDLIVAGGPSDTSVEIINTNGLELTNYFSEGAKVSPESQGVPLSYTFRYLKNDDIVKIPFQIEYGAYDCVTTESQEVITVSLDKVCVLSSSNDDPEIDFDFRVNFEGESQLIHDNPANWTPMVPAADCSQELEIDETESQKLFTFVPKNDTCFNLTGTFYKNWGIRNPSSKIDIPYCYQNGSLSPELGSNNKIFDIEDTYLGVDTKITIQVFWNVEGSTP